MRSILRLNIANKLLLGYLFLSLLLIIISVFTLSNLERLNKINTSIIRKDSPVIEVTDKMIDSILAQELYARRFALLRTADMLGLFWKRNQEFEVLIDQIEGLPEQEGLPIETIRSLYKEYTALFSQGINSLDASSTTFSLDYDREIKEKQEALIDLIKKISGDALVSRNEKTSMTAYIASRAFRVTAFLCAFGILLGIGTAMIITRNISKAIRQLKLATEKIAEGNFEETPKVTNRDELGDLAAAFSKMASRLKALEEMYLDASPLTRLPGNVAIENVLKKRLEADGGLAFCFIDIDNFKSYNDRYGYARGSELILKTAHIIEDAVVAKGTTDDFIGHVGGDDYVVISTPDRYKEISNDIIARFDAAIPDYYDEEDRRLGYILGKTRQGGVLKFPLVTLSIAVVTNEHRKLLNHIHVGEIAAELKEYAKSIPGSLFVVDKRRGVRTDKNDRVDVSESTNI